MRYLLLLLFGLFGRQGAHAQNFDTRQWFKGNTHTHSLWSDGNDFPEMIFDWYRAHGYQFVAMSDHNLLQVGTKWMSVVDIKKRQRALGLDAIAKCEARFGKNWLRWETRDETPGVVLKTLDECRVALEQEGKFYLLPAVEMSNSGIGKKPVHINVLNLSETIAPIQDASLSTREVARASLRLIAKTANESSRPILAHLNHPNFQWSLTAADLADVAEGDFFEVYNGHPGINHLGDAERPGDEAIWDIANTIRLAEMNKTPLLGVATDDSHTYHGEDVSPGRGWIRVGADVLTGDSLIQAFKDGRFYASSGVELEAIRFDEESRTLTIQIAPVEGVTFTTRFIGTRSNYDATAEVTGIGEVFASIEGVAVRYAMPEDAYYLRATVTSSRAHPNPSYPDQKEQAWVQPVGWQR